MAEIISSLFLDYGTTDRDIVTDHWLSNFEGIDGRREL
jgi:hypothetical protein